MERVGKVVALKGSEAACRMMGPGKGNAPGDKTARHAPPPRVPNCLAPHGERCCARRGTRPRFASSVVHHPLVSMPTTLPPSVQETLGDPAADDFARWLDENFDQRTVHPKEYREVLSRLDVIDERFDVIDERFERVDERFERVEERIDGTNERLDRMDERFEKRFDQIDQRFEEQSAQFNQRLDEQSHQFNQRIDGVNERFDGLNERFDAMNERIDRLHEQMRVQARWTVGTIALFGTIVTVLLAIAEFSA